MRCACCRPRSRDCEQATPSVLRLLLRASCRTRLRTENGGLRCALVSDTVKAAEWIDQSRSHSIDFGDCQVLHHLPGQTLEQVAIAFDRLLEIIHHPRAYKVL